VVPERFVAPGNLTASAYLTHLARIRSRDAAAMRERSLALLDRLGLEPGASVPMRLLSKGNAQKVAITQAFGAEASLLVLDEPRAGLDVRANGVLDELIEEARSSGSIVLLSGHEDRQPTVVDQALVLADGMLSTADRLPERVSQRLIRLAATELSRPLDGLPPGVTAQSVSEAGVESALTVAESQVDAVLRVALDRGWSVLEVSGVSGASRESAS
jgi:ABC-type multidrug transport system ATPase subunit